MSSVIVIFLFLKFLWHLGKQSHRDLPSLFLMMYQLLTPLGLLTQRIRKLPYLPKTVCYPSTKFPPCLNLKHNYFKHPFVWPGHHTTERSGMGGVGQGCWPRADEEGRVVSWGKFRKACEESWDLDTWVFKCMCDCLWQICRSRQVPTAQQKMPGLHVLYHPCLPPQPSVFSLCDSQPCPGHSWPAC